MRHGRTDVHRELVITARCATVGARPCHVADASSAQPDNNTNNSQRLVCSCPSWPSVVLPGSASSPGYSCAATSQHSSSFAKILSVTRWLNFPFVLFFVATGNTALTFFFFVCTYTNPAVLYWAASSFARLAPRSWWLAKNLHIPPYFWTIFCFVLLSNDVPVWIILTLLLNFWAKWMNCWDPSTTFSQQGEDCW